MDEINELKDQVCPICHAPNLTLTESEMEVPYFGKVFLFSMACDNCKYHKADIEPAETHEPTKYSVEVSSESDLRIRVVKSSQATVKIPHITTITPGPASNGYVTNVEGILNRVKREIEILKDSAEDDEDKKKAKNLLKKLQKVLYGQDRLKIIIEDPSGNSAIISDKAVKSKL
ncbi:MAG: ZPR1 zinc finger domain-containing protein [Candidatus Woesearchaeota archaeon]